MNGVKENVLNYLKRHNEAIQCFNRAIEINPSNSEVYFNIVEHLSDSNMHENAIKYFNQAIEV